MIPSGQKSILEAAVFFLLILLLVCGAFFVRPLRASRTWTVDKNGNADFEVIKDAIGNATDGDVILVSPGIYYEHIIVDKSLKIDGLDNTRTVINGNDAATVVTLTANGASFSGFTVQNGDGGLRVIGHSNNVSNNVIIGNGVGIILDAGSERNILANNTVTLSEDYGLYSDRSGTNVISNNNISFNGWDGVFLYASGPCLVENNTFSSNGLDGVRLRYSSNNTITRNFFSANRNALYVYSDQDPLRPGGLSKYNVVEWNTAENNSCGIKIEHAAKNTDSAGNLVCENYLFHNNVGLNVTGSNGNSVYHNNFVSNSRQASVTESSNNTWDRGYYIGGNYWSDHPNVDLHWGVAQNETGADGVCDMAYAVSEKPVELDMYPYVAQYGWLDDIELEVVSPINAMYRINPIPLVLVMNKPLAMSFSLDGQSNVSITGSVVFANLSKGTHNVIVVANDSIGNEVSLEILFTQTFLADIDLDGKVNIIDIAIVAYSFGHFAGSERWNPSADLNNDGQINILDIALVATEFNSEIPS